MRALALLAATSLAVACSRPSPPTLTPKKVTVAAISPTELDLEVLLDATNPNAIDIPAKDVTAHAVIDKRIEVGAATTEQTTNLPANQTTELKVAVAIPWNDVLPLAQLALGDRRTFPYTVDGTVALGGDLLHVILPFHLEGYVSREQINRAVMNSIPTIPGITVAPGTPSAAPTIPPAAPLPGAPPHAPRIFR